MASENNTRSFKDCQEAGGAVIVYVTPSNWQPIGCVAARLLEEKTRERLQPRAAFWGRQG